MNKKQKQKRIKLFTHSKDFIMCLNICENNKIYCTLEHQW